MEHSLINPNHISNYGHTLSDNSFDSNKDIKIYHDKIFVQFSTKESAVYFTAYVTMDEDLET